MRTHRLDCMTTYLRTGSRERTGADLTTIRFAPVQAAKTHLQVVLLYGLSDSYDGLS